MFSRREVALASPLFVAVAAILLFALACSSPSSGRASALDCLDADDIVAMRAEWNADEKAAESKYAFREFCVEAEFGTFRESASFTNISGSAEDSSLSILHSKEGSFLPASDRETEIRQAEEIKKSEELKAWVEDSEFGDTFRASCMLVGFEESGDSYHILGTPEFRDCELIKE